MIKVVQTERAGDAGVLTPAQVQAPVPGEGQILLDQKAIGVNMIDIYHRTSTQGQYALPHPAVLGVEGAGVVEAVGPNVTNVKVGDRVGYWMVVGAYAEKRLVPANRVVKIPEAVSFEAAAAGMVKGVTAYYLLHRVFPVKPGQVVVVYAAAGGVGQMLAQWAKALGAVVIGTVGSQAKVAVAKAAGCDHVLLHGSDDIAAGVRGLTQGKGADVVFDSIGKDTFDASLNALKPLGMLVCYGQATGPVPPVDISVLAQKGSVFLAKPTLATFVQNRADIEELSNGLFDAMAKGIVTPVISERFALDDVARAHDKLESRATTGSIVLVP